MVVKPWERRSTRNNLVSGASGTTAPAASAAAAESSSENKKSSKILRYPYDRVKEGDDYLKIEIVKFKPVGIQNRPGSFALQTTDDVQGLSAKDPQKTIILPIPEGVGDTNNASWENAGMNPVQAGLAGFTGDFLEGAGQVSLPQSAVNAYNNAKERVGSTLGETESIKRLVQGGTAALVSSALTGQNPGGLISRATGFTLNPNSQMLFNGVASRSFGFNWDIVPRYKEEAEQIKQIIRTFKYHMSASNQSNGIFIDSPDIFYLSYKSGSKDHPFLHRFKPMALTSMSVNYTGSGTYATYNDSTPVHMQLSLSFSELTPIYRSDYDTDQGKKGVGY